LNENPRGLLFSAIMVHIRAEITELGCSERTAKRYIDDLKELHYTQSKDGLHITISKTGKEWLKRHT